MAAKEIVLFLLTISPVQPFIAQSRKTQDLYAGSFILSHLCETGIKALEESLQERTGTHTEPEIIFPHKSITSKPNRFLAKIEVDPTTFYHVGKSVEKRIRDEWIAMGEKVLKRLGVLEPPTGFDKQMNFFLQIQWLIQPFQENDYKTTYESIEQGMGELKIAKPFFQLAEQGRKCTLTGEHNALFYRQRKNRDNQGKRPAYIVRDAVEIPDQLSQKYIADGEALSAIGIVKRCADFFFYMRTSFNDQFPSKADIALMDSIHRLKVEFDKDPESYDASSVLSLKHARTFDNPLDDQTQERTSKIYEALGEQKLPFTSYYALLLFDGDHMGRWFTGENMKPEKSSQLPEFHNFFSKELGEFANKAKEILQAPRGAVVYAGGDDFLGFVNIHHLFDVMQELREEFGKIDLSRYTDEKLTFSAGVVISHHKDMLSVTLNKAREMEQLAKQNGRDSFGICLLRHSGEISQTVYKWQDDKQWLTEPMQRVVTGLTADFSDTFIRSFIQEMSRLLDREGKIHPNQTLATDMMKAELVRLLKRACQHQDKEQKRQLVDAMQEDLFALFQAGKRAEGDGKQVWQNYFSLLEILMFIERETKQERKPRHVAIGST